MSVLMILKLIAKNERTELRRIVWKIDIYSRQRGLIMGEWIQGYLYGIWEKRYILWGMTNDVPNMIEVDPTTICQCTGLKDKNDKLIWENDIMKYQWDGKIRIDVVKYEPPIFSYKNVIRWSLYQDEVIGNIFDNKELLESEG